MQIHEITKRPLKEGLLGNIGRGLASGATGFDIPQSQASIDRDAAQAATQIKAKGLDQVKIPTVQDAVAGVQKNPAQQQYIKDLVKQWSQSAPKPEPIQTPDQTRAQTTGTTSADWRQDALKSVGATIPQGPAQAAAATAGTSAVASASRVQPKYGTPGAPTEPIMLGGKRLDPRNPNDAKIIAAMQSQGKLQEAPQEYVTTPGGIAAPQPLKKTSGVAPAQDTAPGYQAAFEKWAAEKLLTKEPATRQMITLADVKATDIGDELGRALAQVVATARDPQKNAVAVNNYLTIAVAGVARQAQKLRSETGRGGAAGAVPNRGTAGGAIVTQQEIKDRLAQEVRLGSDQVEALKKIAQDPAARQALLKSLGVQS